MSQIYGIITQEVNDMAKDKYLQFMIGDVTQSAADAATSVEMPMPTSPSEGQAIAIYRIEWGPMDINMTANLWIQQSLAVTDGIAAGDLHPGNRDVVALIELGAELTTSGGSIHEKMPNPTIYPEPIIVAHPRLYLYCTSTGTGVVNKARARIYFKFVKLTSEEFWQHLAEYE